MNVIRSFTFFILALFLSINILNAQTPYFRNINPLSTGSVISGGMPFGVNAVNGARAQYFYPPSFLTTYGPTSITPISRLYFFADTTKFDTVLYSNIIITMGEYAAAPTITIGAWNTAASKLTTVLSVGGGLTINPVDYNWFYIDLTTPYLYDPSKYLLLDIRVDGQSPFTTSWNIKSSSTSGSYFSASTGSAATPSTTGLGGSMPALGMDPVRGLNNAGMDKVSLPAVCASSSSVIVKVKNSGQNVLSNVHVGWSINGVTQTPLTITGPIDTFGSVKNDTLITLGTVSFASGPRSIVAWTYLPNGVADISTADDTVSFTLASSLNGTYSIGPTSPNFNTITSAVSAMYAYGVCGPVTFLLDTVTFLEQVELIGRINGASPINTVTFQGIDKTKSIISYFPIVVNAKHIVKMQTVSYVTFRNLTIRSLSTTYGWGVHIRDTCVSVGIKNCIIDNTSTATSTSATNSVGITISGPATGTCIPAPCATSLTAASRADSIEIDSNTILYGYEGINITGNATTNLGHNNKIRNNTILYAYQYSINLVSQDNVQVKNNTIMPRQTGAVSCGIFASAVTSSGFGVPTDISSNKIFGYATAGISLNTCNSIDSTNKGRITNNMIGGMEQLIDANPIYITGCKNWTVSHNSLNRDFPNTTLVTSSGIRILGTTSNITIKNNIISISKVSAAIPLHILATTNIDSMDRNILYRADMSNSQLINLGGTAYTLSNYKGAGGFNSNSTFLRPPFKNDTNLYLQTNCGFPTAEYLSYVTKDINGTTRLNPPVAGAHELIRQNNNISVVSILQPSSPIAPGSYTMNVLLQNTGGNPVSNFNISYRVNSATLITIPKTLGTPLNPCDSTVISITGVTFTSADSIAQLLVYTSQPNGFSDPDPSNDTLRVKLYAPLGGDYTLGGLSAQFATFSDAALALRAGGIYKSVRFIVNAGTYTEQVSINGPISGSSPLNTITFDGVDPLTRTVTYPGNAGIPYTIKIDSAPYVSLRNLSIVSTGATWGWGVQITRNANACKIKNCIVSINGAGTTSTTTNFTPITISGATATTATHADSLEIDSNSINYGYNGINMYAATGVGYIGINNKIRNNNVQNAYQYSIYLVYQQTPEILNNIIPCRGSAVGVGIYLQNVTTPATGNSFTNIRGNKINNYATAGIYLNTCTNSLNTLKGKIINNTIGGLEKLAAGNSLYLTSSTNWSICNNSINHDFATTTATTSSAVRIVGAVSASFGNTITNNVVAVTGAGTGLPLYTQVAGNIDSMDYNLFYRADTTNGFSMYLGANITLPAFKGNGGFNKNSIIYRPGFTSTTDLTPNPADSAVWSINGRGVFLPYAPTDINGIQRPTNPYNGVPDIGAFELTPTSTPPLAKASPDTIIWGTTQSFLFGYDTVMKISWQASYAPSNIKIRQYSGARPPYADTTKNYMYFYTTFNCGVTFFDSLSYYYRDNWIGTHITEAGIKPWQMDTNTFAWSMFTGTNSIDIARNIIKIPNYFNTGVNRYMTGSDNNSVILPVTFIDLKAYKQQQQVILNWITATEKNTNHFEIERSFDGINFKEIGMLKAKGNSNYLVNYSFTDALTGVTLGSTDIIYYRLKTVDKDGQTNYSKTVSLRWTDQIQNTFTVYPNPFNSSFTLQVTSDVADGNAKVIVRDITGKELINNVISVALGNNLIDLSLEKSVKPGLYFIELETVNKTSVIKVMKQ